jgi:hypothetical protein
MANINLVRLDVMLVREERINTLARSSYAERIKSALA